MIAHCSELGRAVAITTVLAAALTTGCTLAPEGLDEQKGLLEAAGTPFEPPVVSRSLLDLPPAPTWREVLHRAFLANGELEAAYFEWSKAVSGVEVVSSYPNSNLSLGYGYLFSTENMKAFDRMSFSAGVDPMENLRFPVKAAKAGEVALSDARAAGERFRAKKFELQERVLTAWAEYAFLAEASRVQLEQVSLSKLLFQTASARVRAGGAQSDLLRAGIELRTAEDRAKGIDAEVRAARSTLNALLARPAEAPLAAPDRIEPRLVAVDDAALLAAAVDRNPELAALSHDVHGRSDALELARLEWVPDINPSLVLAGTVSQAVGAALVLPTTLFEIRGKIDEARATLRAAEASLRQAKHSRASEFVAALALMRNSERQARLFRDHIIPAAEHVLGTLRAAYFSGNGTYLELIDSQRALLDVRLVLAEALASREKRLAELERLSGIDLETLPRAEPSAREN